MPSTPPAPPRLSTMINWPRLAPSLSATMRATASTPPPAGNGTIMVSGRDGYLSCAAASRRQGPAKARIAIATSVPRPRILIFSCAVKSFFLLQALRCLLDDAQVGVFLDIEIAPNKAEVARHVDVALQRRQVGHHVTIVVGIPAREQPIELRSRLFGHARRDLHRRLVIGRVEIPAHDAQRVLHKVHEHGAVLVDERLAR